MKQVKTGIPGLDELLGGGLFQGSTVLLIGPVGTLKSYMGQQFIWNGLEGGEPCIYMSTSQSLSDVEFQIKLNFGWDLKPYLQKKQLRFVDIYTLCSGLVKPLDIMQIAEKIFEAERNFEGGRELFYNLSLLFNLLEDEKMVLRLLYALRAKAKEKGITVLLILDEGAQSSQFEQNLKSLCDYVLKTSVSGGRRRIIVEKSLTTHGLELHNLIISGKGVSIEVIR